MAVVATSPSGVARQAIGASSSSRRITTSRFQTSLDCVAAPEQLRACHGGPPGARVEVDPALVRQGRDPQLEKAVEVVLDQLEKHPLATYKRPEYPNYHQTLPK